MKNPSLNAIIGGILTATLLTIAVVGSFWTPYNPLALDFTARLAPPSAVHWLGTDEFGRDQLSRLMRGASASVSISVFTVFLATLGGVLIGAISGFLRGWFDRLLMMVNDALLAFPGILMALGLLAVFGANKNGIILALALAYMSSVIRVVRGTVLSLREREFVEASRVMGNSEIYTMVRHILPNCLAPVLVMATSMCGWAILAESSLSFWVWVCRRQRPLGATCWPEAAISLSRLFGLVFSPASQFRCRCLVLIFLETRCAIASTHA